MITNIRMSCTAILLINRRFIQCRCLSNYMFSPCIITKNFSISSSQKTFSSQTENNKLFFHSTNLNRHNLSNFSTDSKDNREPGKLNNEGDIKKADVPVKKSSKVRFKQAVKEYGATTIVFHVGISLMSLGICYLAISNGVDAVKLLTFIGFSEAIISNKVAVGGSTFVIAYAVHKLFAPVRIAITLSSVPFIVRYLRKIKFLKTPK